jgi:hypothetical protein
LSHRARERPSFRAGAHVDWLAEQDEKARQTWAGEQRGQSR